VERPVRKWNPVGLSVDQRTQPSARGISMNEAIIDCLTQRVNRLEKENRRMKRLAGLAVVGITALMLMGQAKPSHVPKVSEAERFVLRDPNGKVRAALAVVKNQPVLTLHDSDEKMKVLLNIADSGEPTLRLFGNDGSESVYLSNALGYHDRRGLRLMLGQVDKQGPFEGPFLRLYDANGTNRASLVTSDDGSSLTLYGKDGKGQVALQSRDDGKQNLVIKPEGSEHGMVLTADTLVFSDQGGKIRAGLTVLREGAGLALYDRTGKAIWSAP
jgi:hypothetical protein